MTLATMIYGLIVAALVGGAAWFLDRGLRALGRPTRWVWIGAIGVGGLAPLFPRLLPAAAPEGGPGSFVLPVRALYELGTPAPPLPEHSGSFLAGVGLENSLGALWILGSILVLILFALICLRLRRLRATWEPQDVCGEQVLRSEKFGPAVVGLISVLDRPSVVELRARRARTRDGRAATNGSTCGRAIPRSWRRDSCSRRCRPGTPRSGG